MDGACGGGGKVPWGLWLWVLPGWAERETEAKRQMLKTKRVKGCLFMMMMGFKWLNGNTGRALF